MPHPAGLEACSRAARRKCKDSAGSQLPGGSLAAGVVLVLSSYEGMMATRNLAAFISNESGQDLIEYSLLIAFVALAGAAMFIGMSGSVNSIWSAANSRLAAANSGS